MNAPQAVYIDGVRCFAPELAESCADYPKEFFDKLAEIEDTHFWFCSRNAVIRGLVEKFLGAGASPRQFLEIGCGTGYVLRMLASIPGIECTGAEIHLAGVHIAKSRVPSIEIVQLDATAIPFQNAFDGVGAFDVIEHIENDEKVLQNVHHSLKSGGYFFITVPQHRFLWSFADDFAGHKRRYTRADLVTKLTQAGFEIEYAGSFCAVLLPLMLFVRLTKKAPPDTRDAMAIALTEFQIPAWLNRVLRTLLRIDEALIRRGWSSPFGGSLIVVAKKRLA
jgi:SAM-dependent methyltransferase